MIIEDMNFDPGTGKRSADMADFAIMAVILVIMAVALGYIVKAKKSGAKCIGCPVQGGCGNRNGVSGCNCGCVPGASQKECE